VQNSTVTAIDGVAGAAFGAITALVPRAPCSACLLRSAASQNRDPGCGRGKLDPDSAAHCFARATRCAASGARSPHAIAHEHVNISLSPPSPPRLSSTRPVQRGGASRGDPEVGQSESWPEGQPEGRCGAWGCARKHGPGRPWVSVRPVRVCHCELAGRGQASGAKTPCSRTSIRGLPSPRKNGPGF
jgi:hypothetical protein